MGKSDFLSPKAIANRIKSKGLQKLRWYCQMCQKQCRDEVRRAGRGAVFGARSPALGSSVLRASGCRGAWGGCDPSAGPSTWSC